MTRRPLPKKPRVVYVHYSLQAPRERSRRPPRRAMEKCTVFSQCDMSTSDRARSASTPQDLRTGPDTRTFSSAAQAGSADRAINRWLPTSCRRGRATRRRLSAQPRTASARNSQHRSRFCTGNATTLQNDVLDHYQYRTRPAQQASKLKLASRARHARPRLA